MIPTRSPLRTLAGLSELLDDLYNESSDVPDGQLYRDAYDVILWLALAYLRAGGDRLR